MVHLIKALLLPPGGPLLLVAAGLLLLWQGRMRAGRLTVLAGAALLWALALPVVSGSLLQSLEGAWKPLESVPADAGAIVVLGGGRYAEAPEYHADTLAARSLVRIRYAARLHHISGLPVIPSGGAVFGTRAPEAELAAQVLGEFGVTTVWPEGASRTTWQNARETARLLDEHGIGKVVLVTHAWHMSRAMASFAAHGVDAVAAPTAYTTVERPLWLRLVPEASALKESRWALHEWLGRLWYALK